MEALIVLAVIAAVAYWKWDKIKAMFASDDSAE